MELFTYGAGGHHYYFYSDGEMARSVNIWFNTQQGWVKYRAETDGRVEYGDLMDAMEALAAQQLGQDIFVF